MLQHDPAAKTHDRIGFTLSMAIALHVAVVLGVGFALQVPKAPSSTRMDITLSHYQADRDILDADFVAQTNQEASGTENRKVELKTTEQALINSSEIKPIQNEQQAIRQQQKSQSLQLLSSAGESKVTHADNQPDQRQEQLEEIQAEREQLQRQLEIASLQAKLDQEQQVYARLPKVRRASSVATKAAADAEYLYKWQRRIETIGNQYYPEEARSQQLYGDVQVLVSIKSDGYLQDVKILKSSGARVLDDAALRIVRLASPFQPFPAEMKQDTDILEIVRTWEFRKDHFSRSSQ